jgi:hypothetical protein
MLYQPLLASVDQLLERFDGVGVLVLDDANEARCVPLLGGED